MGSRIGSVVSVVLCQVCFFGCVTILNEYQPRSSAEKENFYNPVLILRNLFVGTSHYFPLFGKS